MYTPKPKQDLTDLDRPMKKEIYNHFALSIKNTGGLQSTDSFNGYESNRIKTIDGFSKVQAGGSTVSDKLKATTPEATHAREEIKKAFVPTVDYKNAKDNFNTDLKNLNQLLEAQECTLADAGSFVLEAKNTAVNNIKAQQDHEKENLTKLRNNNQFKENMITALGCSEAEFNGVIDEMISTLKKSQQEQLKKLEKSLEETANQLFKKQEQEFYRITYLGRLYLTHQKEEITELVTKNDSGKLTAKVGEKGSDILKNVDAKDLKTHLTISGKTLYAGEDGSLSIELSRWFMTSFEAYEALTSIAEELKARGCDTITFQVNDKDPERADEIGRKAYESAIIAGFDPKKIKIVVNGVDKHKHDDKGKLEKNDLFKKFPERLQVANENYEKRKEDWKAIMQGNKLPELKTKLQELKSAQGDVKPEKTMTAKT